MASTSSALCWQFPLPRVHCGILIGNGIQGVMVWGGEHTLYLTVSRAGFWDRRGGSSLSEGLTYPLLRQVLESGDRARFNQHFRNENPTRSYQIGGGRFEIDLGSWQLQNAYFRKEDGCLTIHLSTDDGEATALHLYQARHRQELFCLEYPEGLVDTSQVRFRPAWDFIGQKLASLGITPPTLVQRKGGGLFCQRLPVDHALAIAWQWRRGSFIVATGLGENPEPPVQRLVTEADTAAFKSQSALWWQNYYADVPKMELPDADLQSLYDHGIHKQAGLTDPDGIAATLQGPWMEEFQLPPWSNDYHFNINAQMIYGACLPTGRAAHLGPLWELLGGLQPEFRKFGKQFFGADDALLIPHAIDDRGQIVGNFWTGMIDQGCVAWLGLLAWQHYRHTLKREVLTETALPLLSGAFGGFWAMADKENGRLSLPLTVSPEFRGSQFDAWGTNANFQLSAFQLTARLLQQIARLLGREEDPRWGRVLSQLPPYSLFKSHGSERLGIWDHQDLDECHRHHSHLAAIHPFRTLNVYASDSEAVIRSSLRHWLRLGAGEWTGWSIPWASQIVARCGLVDAAVGWLKWLHWVYTNAGHNTLHNSDFSGSTAWDDGALDQPGYQHTSTWPGHIMQTDAAMGAVSAICDLFVQNEPTHLRLMRRLPKGWQSFQVQNLSAEGGLRVSLTAHRGEVDEVTIQASQPFCLRLDHGMAAAEDLHGQRLGEGLYQQMLQAGESVMLRRIRR